jgi:hypothetical protein
LVQSLSIRWRGTSLVLLSASPLPHVLLGLPSDASTWGGGIGYNNLTVLCGQLGLVAAFALIVAIIAAPLLQRVWSPEVVVAQR